jgi:hypothetical protein
MGVTAQVAEAVRQRETPPGEHEPRCQLCRLNEYDLGLGRFHLHHVDGKGMGGTADPACDDPAQLRLLHEACHRVVHNHPIVGRALGLLGSRLGTVRRSTLIAEPRQIRAWKPSGVAS